MRRRKGLSEDVSIDKFFDESMKAQMAATENEGLDMTEVSTSPMEEGERMKATKKNSHGFITIYFLLIFY